MSFLFYSRRLDRLLCDSIDIPQALGPTTYIYIVKNGGVHYTQMTVLRAMVKHSMYVPTPPAPILLYTREVPLAPISSHPMRVPLAPSLLVPIAIFLPMSQYLLCDWIKLPGRTSRCNTPERNIQVLDPGPSSPGSRISSAEYARSAAIGISALHLHPVLLEI